MVEGVSFRGIPHTDALMVLHIDATLTHAYLTSLPRDLLVSIPANPASGTSARSSDKITHAITYGARVPGSNRQDLNQGFALTARTVSNYTGIDHFDAGAVVSFEGLSRLVDVLGGIDIYVDHKVTSHHMGPDGRNAELKGGPFMVYEVGPAHLNGWQALDYARQRYSLPNGTYDRERHHRQIVKALVTKLVDFQIPRYPLMASFYVQYVSAINLAFTVDLRGRPLSQWIYALRNLTPEAITLVGLPGGGVSGSSGYLGERLRPIEADYFAAVRDDTVGEFLATHPELTEGQDPTAQEPTPGSSPQS
jgi:LCP family protein required for cell wall assembly